MNTPEPLSGLVIMILSLLLRDLIKLKCSDSSNQIARMTNFDQSENDKKFSIFSILLHYLNTILNDFCSILRHNSKPLSFQ